MKKTTLSVLLIFIIVLFANAGCGKKHDDALPATAFVKIISQGTHTQIGGINVTVVLPSGVSVKATPDSTNAAVQVTNPGVVVASGVAAGANTNTLATYSAATTSTPGKVMVNLFNANGFGAGEFVTIQCDIATGNFPQATDFSVTLVKAVDLDGAAITGLTVGNTVDIQ